MQLQKYISTMDKNLIEKKKLKLKLRLRLEKLAFVKEDYK